MSKLLTTREVANLFQVDPRTIQRWARERKLPHLRVGRRTIRFMPEHIEQALAAYEQAARQHRPETTTPNPHYRGHIQIVPMRRPTDAA